MSELDALSAEERYMKIHLANPGKGEPPFEEPTLLEEVWGKRWGISNDVGQIRAILISRPGVEWEQMLSGGEFDEELQTWFGPDRMWYWRGKDLPDLELAQKQHDGLTEALRAEGIDVVSVKEPNPKLTRSVFTRDTAAVVKGGTAIDHNARIIASLQDGRVLCFAEVE